MKKFFAGIVFLLSAALTTSAAPRSADVFTPIGKYMQTGDYDRLSVWFAAEMELEILGQRNDCSRNQARLIMKSFFEEYTPKSFTVVHKSGQATMKYAIAELKAGGETFRVLLYVNNAGGHSYIERLSIRKPL